MKSSSKERLRAQELASHCAILKITLGLGGAGAASAVLFAQDAVEITRDFGHIGLHLSALSKLAWAHLYMDQDEAALLTAEEARAVLERYKNPLPVCISGGTYSTLSVCQAKNFLDPDYALKKAGEQNPGNQILYGMNFTEPVALLERGVALGYTGQTGAAMEAYSRVVDPKTLEITPSFQDMVSKGWYRTTLFHMAEASLTGKTRDMDEAIRYWQAALDRARKLSSKLGERQMRAVYREMLRVFPGEDRIKKLGEQLRKKAQNNPGEN